MNPVGWPMCWSVCATTRTNRDRAWSQLGTSGSGNHFVEFGVLAVSAKPAAEGLAANVALCADEADAHGANDAVQLADLSQRLNARRVRELLLGGVRMADPASVQVRADVAHGRDVEFDASLVLVQEAAAVRSRGRFW